MPALIFGNGTNGTPGAPAEIGMLAAAEELSRAHMSAYNDPSHDWLHVARVRRLALLIGRQLPASETVDMLVVELAALFHDLHDSKYAAQTSNAWEDLYMRFFKEHLATGAISEAKARLVCQICESVSYSKEVKRIKNGLQTPFHESCLELHCVQDADKLDAMGGIGIMRCAAYSAAKNRPLSQPGNPDDAITHFHDKLLRLKSMMRTEIGKQLAEKRHQAMLDFLASVEDEESQC